MLCECGYEWGLGLDDTGFTGYPLQQLAEGQEEREKEGRRKRERRDCFWERENVTNYKVFDNIIADVVCERTVCLLRTLVT